MKGQSTLAGRILTVDATGVALVLGLSAVGYVLGVGPVLNARAQAQEHRALLEEQARTVANQESLIAVEQRKLTDLAQRLEQTSVQLHPAGDINRRLANITRISGDHGLSIQQLDPGQPSPGGEPGAGKFCTVPIRIVGTGAFNGIAGFLKQILKEYPDIEVRAMLANAPPEGASDAAFSVDLRWYAAPAGGADSAAAASRK